MARTVCLPSGLQPSEYCQQQRSELFIAGTEPKVQDNLWQPFEIDKSNGLLATAATAPENRENKVFLILPPEAEDWVRESGIAQPPRGESNASFEFDPEVAITFPEPGSYISATVEIRGNARGDFRNYRVEFGTGLNPTEWQQIGPEHGEQVEGGVLEVDSDDERIVGTRALFDMLSAEPRLDATAVQTVGAKKWDGFVLARVR